MLKSHVIIEKGRFWRRSITLTQILVVLPNTQVDKDLMLTCILFVIVYRVGCGEVGMEVFSCDLDKETSSLSVAIALGEIPVTC